VNHFRAFETECLKVLLELAARYCALHAQQAVIESPQCVYERSKHVIVGKNPPHLLQERRALL
jgi:hypothetical protein